MMKTIKIIVIVAIAFATLMNCKRQSKIDSQAEVIHNIRETRCQYDDKKLVEEMVRLCNSGFKNIDDEDLAIIFNYVVSCHNEDASEGLYDVLVNNIINNEPFLLRLTNFLKAITISNKEVFVEKMADSIVWFQYVINANDDELNSNYVDSLSAVIKEQLPSQVFNSFLGDNPEQIKQLVRKHASNAYGYYIKDIF